MNALLDLASRCEAATEVSRELDEEIAAALAGAVREVQPDGRTAYHRDVRWVSVGPVEPVTASLDAAMSLVPEGCGFLLTDTHVERWAQIVSQGMLSDGTLTVGPGLASSKAATPALALCAAALRARAASCK